MLSKLLCVLLLSTIVGSCNGGTTSKYVRKYERTIPMPYSDFPKPSGFNAPEQVHITQGDHDGRGVIISWVTPEQKEPDFVKYWEEGKKHKNIRPSTTTTYRYFNYSSGFIHHATIKHLKYNTKYFYELGTGDSTRQFYFVTPPPVGPDVPYTFGIMGDLGQTYASNSTLAHYVANPKAQAMLFCGDLSYADDHAFHNQIRWDTWGRFVEKSTAYQPWIWSPGNHELDFAPEIGETVPFKPYLHRYYTPYKASGSTSPLWYSIKRGPAYIIILSSFSSYGKYTPQWTWLKNELPKVNRAETPWLIVLLHTPWYNSNNYHYMEGETMRVQFERWFVQYKVDLVFAGHVHAYERTGRVSNVRYNITDGYCNPIKDQSAPIYMTLGDGGNQEGMANNFIDPQPNYSVFREASFGHSILDIKNRTHAYYTWHRNQDDEPVTADKTWIYNRYWFPEDEEDCQNCYPKTP